MQKILKNLIDCEQKRNNYSLYEGDKWKNYFTMNLESCYLPENQCFFNLPYFLIPIGSDKLLYNKQEIDFLSESLFVKNGNEKYYPFFIHPATKDLFLSWIGTKYQFIDEATSLYKATPSSSYRSLFVNNTANDNWFIAKVSLFDNVANGSRHIDWYSASGQFESSQMTCKATKDNNNFIIFEDIAAFGMTGDVPVHLSERFNIQFGSRNILTFGNVIRKIPSEFFINSKKTVCSFASYMSLRLENKNILSISAQQVNQSLLEYFNQYVFNPLFKELLQLFSQHGIVVEPHCQNTLIELDEDMIPTGTFFYRDFDMTTFDRARYPFYYKEDWLHYIENRSDRISLFSNTSMRENIGTGFFNHFFDNLLKPCLISAVKMNEISENEKDEYLKLKFYEMKQEIIKYIPKMNNEFFMNGTSWELNKEYLSIISREEINVEISKLKSQINKDKYTRMLLWKPTHMETDYYITKNSIVLGFQNNILVELLC